MNAEKKNSDAAQNKRRDSERDRPREAARKSPPSPLTESIKISQELESILETKFGAQGRGLLEKATSVADSIPETTLGKIVEIATIRNEAAHNNGKIDQETLAKIRRLRDFVVDEFKKTPKRVNAAPYDRVANMSQKLEDLLATRYGATGRTLHEMLTSVEREVPEDLRKKIRFIATIRNRATHEDVGLAVENLDAVLRNYASVLPELQELAAKRQTSIYAVSKTSRTRAQTGSYYNAPSSGERRSPQAKRRPRQTRQYRSERSGSYTLRRIKRIISLLVYAIVISLFLYLKFLK